MRLVFFAVMDLLLPQSLHSPGSGEYSQRPSQATSAGFAPSDPGSHLGGSSRGPSMPGILDAGRHRPAPASRASARALAPSPPAPMDWSRAGGHGGGAGSGRPAGGHGPAPPWGVRAFATSSPAWLPNSLRIAASAPVRRNEAGSRAREEPGPSEVGCRLSLARGRDHVQAITAECADCRLPLRTVPDAPDEPATPCSRCASTRRNSYAHAGVATGVGAAHSPESRAEEWDPEYRGHRARPPGNAVSTCR